MFASFKHNIITYCQNFYLDFTSHIYTNIQYLKYPEQSTTTVFTRYQLFNRWWTPVMYSINPATIQIKRPVNLGRRWGGDAWLKKQY